MQARALRLSKLCLYCSIDICAWCRLIGGVQVFYTTIISIIIIFTTNAHIIVRTLRVRKHKMFCRLKAGLLLYVVEVQVVTCHARLETCDDDDDETKFRC